MNSRLPCSLTLSACVLFLAYSGAADLRKIRTLDIGARAPDFALPGVDDKTYTLDDFAGAEVLVVVFTANHCPTAQAYEDDLKQLVDDYADQGVALVAISSNDPEALRLDELGYTDLGDTLDDMKIRARDHAFNFPYLYDGDDQAVARAYGAMATPHTFVFDSERKLRYVGRIDNNEREGKATEFDLRNAIDALLAGKEVPVEKTKVFGCSTKWSEKRDTVIAADEKWAAQEVSLETVELDAIRELLANDSDMYRLVNVWATWCAPCRIEFPDLVVMQRMYGHREFELVTISADPPDRRKKVLEFLEENEAALTNLSLDAHDSYALIEAVDPDWEGALPYTLLVAPGGEVLYRHQGLIDPLAVKRAIVERLGRTY